MERRSDGAGDDVDGTAVDGESCLRPAALTATMDENRGEKENDNVDVSLSRSSTNQDSGWRMS